MSNLSLRIGLPVYESVPAHSLAAFLGIADAGPWTIVRGTWIDKARNQIMEEFTEDLLLMLDADMVFTNRDVGLLLQAIQSHPECGAISGHYITRNSVSLPTCDWHHPQNPKEWMSNENRAKRAEREMEHGGLVYVDSFGAGFLAITQEAKRKVGSPWFKTAIQESGDYMGEDTFFNQRLQEEGFKPAVHFGIKLGHVGQRVFHPDHDKFDPDGSRQF